MIKKFALILVVLISICSIASAWTIEDCSAIYKQYTEILSSGTWEKQYDEGVEMSCVDGKVIETYGEDTTEYVLTVSNTGAVYLSTYSLDGMYISYEISFSWGDDAVYMLLTRQDYQQQVSFLYKKK